MLLNATCIVFFLHIYKLLLNQLSSIYKNLLNYLFSVSFSFHINFSSLLPFSFIICNLINSSINILAIVVVVCWERLEAGGEGDDRGWDDWMASPTWRMWVWVNSGSWWWTGRPGLLQSMGSLFGHRMAATIPGIQWKNRDLFSSFQKRRTFPKKISVRLHHKFG